MAQDDDVSQGQDLFKALTSPAPSTPGKIVVRAPTDDDVAEGQQIFRSMASPPSAAPAPPTVKTPEGDKPQITGMKANIGAGMVEGGAGTLNALSDPFGNLVGKPLVAAGLALHHALAPYLGLKELTPEQRAFLLDDDVPQPGTRVAAAIGRAMDAPQPEQVVPATQGEQYARAAAQGAAALGPMAGVPGIVAGGAGGVLGQAASDAVSDPYKPVASMAGNAAGAMALGAGRGAVNRLTGTTDPLATTAVNDYGIPLRAGQVSGSKVVRSVDNQLGGLPFSGREAMDAAQRSAFNRAVAETFGEKTDRIDPAVMQQAKTRIGGVMNDIANRTTIKVDPQLVTDLSDIAREAKLLPPVFGSVKAQLTNVLDTVTANGGVLPGDKYQALISHKSALTRAQNAQDPTLRQFANDIREALDDAFQRSAAPGDAAKLAEARMQYKNMMTVAPLVNSGTPGEISPALLQSAANRSFKQNAFRGAGDLGELGDIGQRFLKAPPDSGSPDRMLANNLMFGSPNATAWGRGEAAVRGAVGLAANRLLGNIVNRSPVGPRAAMPLPTNLTVALQNRLLADQRSQ